MDDDTMIVYLAFFKQTFMKCIELIGIVSLLAIVFTSLLAGLIYWLFKQSR